jgi:hypothetical protein
VAGGPGAGRGEAGHHRGGVHGAREVYSPKNNAGAPN